MGGDEGKIVDVEDGAEFKSPRVYLFWIRTRRCSSHEVQEWSRFFRKASKSRSHAHFMTPPVRARDHVKSSSEVFAKGGRNAGCAGGTEDVTSQTPSCLDGIWIDRGRIRGKLLTWLEGPTVPLRLVGSKSIEVDHEGEVRRGSLQDDGSLLWDDGDVWIPQSTSHVASAERAPLPPVSHEAGRLRETARPSNRGADKSMTSYAAVAGMRAPAQGLCRRSRTSASGVVCGQAGGKSVPRSYATRRPCVPSAAPCSEFAQQQRYTGTIRWSRGSMAWIRCKELAKEYPDQDVFLHRSNCAVRMPRPEERVTFRLMISGDGRPQARDVRCEALGEKMPAHTAQRVSARDWFAQRSLGSRGRP